MSYIDQARTSAADTGRYSKWEPLGKGGTAIVYRVHDNELNCDIAIKLLKPELLTSSTNLELMKKSLRTEVLISRGLRHKNICAIHDLYDGPKGFGTVMDLIKGVELRDWMNDHLEDRVPTAGQRLELLRTLAGALAFAHALPMVHRYLKPQNIFLKGGDIREPVIMDFGFSVIGDKTDQSSVQAFTAKYMAPEQYEAPDKVDKRADLFALGIIAYELFAGRVPPHSLKDVLKTRKPPRIPPREIPPPSTFNAALRSSLDQIILQLTAYEPEHRIQSAEELVALLEKPKALLHLPGSDDTDDRSPGVRYSNWQMLGKGGTANVYRVRDNELKCDVAIKILKPETLTDSVNLATMKQSLRTEVLISRRLRHPNICAIHDLYDGPEGFGTVMDLIKGIELRDWMNQHRDDRFATAGQRLELLRTLAGALAYAHALPMVHRDLKPQNIFLNGGDIRQPVIMDFGFSVIGDRTDRTSVQAFTPKYMAPEQFEAPDKVDKRADLFALGIMAYELFVGRVPPNSLQDILKTRKAPRVPSHEIPQPSDSNGAIRPALDRIILQLTAYEPERRIQSADELVTLLAKPDTLLYPPDYKDPDAGRVLSNRAMRAAELPGGEYYLGGQPGSKSTGPNETPIRKITLTPFLIDRYPVTNHDYLEYAVSQGIPRQPLHDHPIFGQPNHPVVGITFDQALAYARCAGGTLPSEAQWEYAARAGQKLIDYPWGNDPPTSLRANINNVTRGATTVVGAFPEGSNQFEIYDMCGNVWEWCLDVYEEKFYTNIEPGTANPVNNPKIVPVKALRVLRGGSFQSLPVQGRCSFRSCAPPTESRNDIGFRLVYRKAL